MLSDYAAEKLAHLRQQELLAEATAAAKVRHLPHGGVRRALAAALATLARRIDPAVWDVQIGKLPLSAGDAG